MGTDLAHDRRIVGGGAVVIAGMKAGQVEFVVDQIVQRVFKAAGHQLGVEHHGQESRASGTKISGGKVQSTKTKRSAGRVRQALKMAAMSLSHSKHDLPIAPNLLERNFTPEAPNRVWSSDITCIATDAGLAVPDGGN